MGWFDASEYFLMEAVARSRLDDLGAAVDLAIAGDDGDAAARRDLPESPSPWPECGVAECGHRRRWPALDAPGVAR